MLGCVGFLLCCVVLCALFSLVVILPRKGELAALLELCYDCMCSVSLPHGAMVTSAVLSVIVNFQIVLTYCLHNFNNMYAISLSIT